MKYVQLSGLFFFMLCTHCKHKNYKSNIKNDSQKIIDTVHEFHFDLNQYDKNDTLCSNTDKIKFEGISLLAACHVFYSDLVSNSLIRAMSIGSLPQEYNFEIETNKNLAYT